jgi:hypothetical protein
MKKLYLIFFMPCSLLGQVQYTDLMGINSMNDFKQVVIENNYSLSEYPEYLWSGKGSRDDGFWVCHHAMFYFKDSTFSFSFELDDNCLLLSSYRIASEQNSDCPYPILIEEIKDHCEYKTILKDEERDYAVYKCHDSEFNGLFGMSTWGGRGEIKVFRND